MPNSRDAGTRSKQRIRPTASKRRRPAGPTKQRRSAQGAPPVAAAALRQAPVAPPPVVALEPVLRVACESPPQHASVASVFGWFALTAVAALLLVDGSVQALADRLTTTRRVAPPVLPGTGAPLAVADDSDVDPSLLAAAAGPLPGSPGGSATAGVKPVVSAILDNPCIRGTASACQRLALDGFATNVAAARTQTLGRALRISFYGDSVVASDLIPAALRQLVWKEFGNGGPGFVHVVPPHRFCSNESISRSTTGTWQVNAVSTTMVADRWFGPGNSSAQCQDGSAKIAVKDGVAHEVTLHYVAQPGGGTATLTTEHGELGVVDTAAVTKAAMTKTFAVADGFARVELAAAGKLRVFGLQLENATGAVVDNLGVVSVNAKNFANNQPTHFASELAARGADVVVVMIGANEAQWLGPGDQDTKEYQSRFETLLAPIRSITPRASCVVVAPTDQAYVVDGDYASRPVMPLLITAQRNAAIASGCAFFNTYAWMGGKGSAEQWLKKGLVGSDFQHLTRKGASKLADALFRTIVTPPRAR